MPFDKSNIYSPDLNIVLSTKLHFFLRWGIPSILLLMVCGIVLSDYIKYPDVLPTEITFVRLDENQKAINTPIIYHPNNHVLYGICQINTININKVELGQKVNVKILNKANKNLLISEGVVTGISKFPRDGFYEVSIAIYIQRISEGEINGIAFIKLRDISFLDRILLNLKH